MKDGHFLELMKTHENFEELLKNCFFKAMIIAPISN